MLDVIAALHCGLCPAANHPNRTGSRNHPVGACVTMAWGGRQRAMETAQHWDRLPQNQPAEITMFQISEVQESPAFNGRRSFLTLRPSHLGENALFGCIVFFLFDQAGIKHLLKLG
jgi:hypothetical protein